MLKDIAKLVALAMVMTVTTCFVWIWVIYGGDRVLICEPNRLVWATEIVLGLFSLIVCAGILIEILGRMRCDT